MVVVVMVIIVVMPLNLRPRTPTYVYSKMSFWYLVPDFVFFRFLLRILPLPHRQGCYIGQESISRVNAYNAVKAGLYGVAFDEPGVPEGAELVTEETGKRCKNRVVRWLTLRVVITKRSVLS